MPEQRAKHSWKIVGTQEGTGVGAGEGADVGVWAGAGPEDQSPLPGPPEGTFTEGAGAIVATAATKCLGPGFCGGVHFICGAWPGKAGLVTTQRGLGAGRFSRFPFTVV